MARGRWLEPGRFGRVATVLPSRCCRAGAPLLLGLNLSATKRRVVGRVRRLGPGRSSAGLQAAATKRRVIARGRWLGPGWFGSGCRRRRRCGGVFSRWCCRVGRGVGRGSGWQRRERVWRGSGCVAGAGAGVTGLACLRVHNDSGSGSGGGKRRWLGCCRCGGPGRPASRDRAGAGAGAGSAALAGAGCAGGVGSPSVKVVAAVRWVWRSWGCVVAGVCMCGVTSFRYCVMRAADCHLPTADCVLPTAICVLSTGVSGRSRCVLPCVCVGLVCVPRSGHCRRLG